MNTEVAPQLALLTVRELAQTLKVSPRTVESLIKLKRAPPFVRIGRARRWRIQDVNAWLAKEAQSTQP